MSVNKPDPKSGSPKILSLTSCSDPKFELRYRLTQSPFSPDHPDILPKDFFVGTSEMNVPLGDFQLFSQSPSSQQFFGKDLIGLCQYGDYFQSEPILTALYRNELSSGGLERPYGPDVPECTPFQFVRRAAVRPDGAKGGEEFSTIHAFGLLPDGWRDPKASEADDVATHLIKGAVGLCQRKIQNAPARYSLFMAMNNDPIANLYGMRYRTDRDSMEKALEEMKVVLPEPVNTCSGNLEYEKRMQDMGQEIASKMRAYVERDLDPAIAKMAPEIMDGIMPQAKLMAMTPDQRTALEDVIKFGLKNGVREGYFGEIAADLNETSQDADVVIFGMMTLVSLKSAQLADHAHHSGHGLATGNLSIIPVKGVATYILPIGRADDALYNDFDEIVNTVEPLIRSGRIALRPKSVGDITRSPLGLVDYNHQMDEISFVPAGEQLYIGSLLAGIISACSVASDDAKGKLRYSANAMKEAQMRAVKAHALIFKPIPIDDEPMVRLEDEANHANEIYLEAQKKAAECLGLPELINKQYRKRSRAVQRSAEEVKSAAEAELWGGSKGKAERRFLTDFGAANFLLLDHTLFNNNLINTSAKRQEQRKPGVVGEPKSEPMTHLELELYSTTFPWQYPRSVPIDERGALYAAQRINQDNKILSELYFQDRSLMDFFFLSELRFASNFSKPLAFYPMPNDGVK